MVRDTTIGEGRKNRMTQVFAAFIAASAVLGAAYFTYLRLKQPDLSKWFLGRIVDETSSDRLAGAKVTLEAGGVPPTLYSDSEGVFAFPVPAGVTTARVRIEFAGYEHYDRQVSLESTSGVQEIRLRRFGSPLAIANPSTTQAGDTTRLSRPVPPGPNQQSVEGFTFRLLGCSRESTTVTCRFTVVADQHDNDLYMWGTSRLINNSGTEQLASDLSLAGRAEKVNRYGSVSAQLIRGVPIAGSVAFDGIDVSQNRAPVIELISSGFRVQFRDVPLS